MHKIIDQNKNFIYWHTHEVAQTHLQKAIKKKICIEWDISYDNDLNTCYIGHPKEFYTKVKRIPLPKNIDLDKALKMVKDHNDVCIFLDCKNTKVLPKVKTIIQTIGIQRCMIHAFIKEWSQPYPIDTQCEAHWKEEDLPIWKFKRLQKETGVFACGSLRGFNIKKLLQTNIVDNACRDAQGCFSAIGIYLPEGENPPLSVFEKVHSYGLKSLIYIDKPFEKLDFNYIGLSDNIENAMSISAL